MKKTIVIRAGEVGVTRSQQHRARSGPSASEAGGGGVLAAGYLCAILSLLFFPIILGPAAIVCGIVAAAKGHGGLMLIFFSVGCMTAGFLLGAALSDIIWALSRQ